LLVRLTMATRWLKERLSKFSTAVDAYSATQHIAEDRAVESTTSFYG
jgi:hypothetical protein